MAKKKAGAGPKPAKDAGDARLAALDAYLLATAGLTPEGVDRINAEWGLPMGQAPTDMAIDPVRLAASARCVGAPEPDEPAPFAAIERREWADFPATPAASRITPAGNGYEVMAIGDSMAQAGIPDGARLQVRSTGTAAEGDIVVARVPGSGWLLRRLASIGGAALLISENPNIFAVGLGEYAPAEIFGIVTGWTKVAPAQEPRARRPGKAGGPRRKRNWARLLTLRK